ncbi:hypothetical protein SAMN05877809_102563 [Rhodobacter sp. JA431]|uniref:HvfC/BufC N-terminal domain-containing protein n=1 Tax=Rhodobacter sp. JA431 TaxID=570013 RepID=UPI000BD0DAF4|nr:DNA-binding domain-containing protein [Rhodobacter sp. JA431]SOC00126.1 hypothetical protein SAMN05877809_102563 [Rhodobacter sp. JA431]
MSPHSQTLDRFGVALAGGAVPQGVTADPPEEAERRFNVYRNNVAVSLGAALAQRFAVIARLVGEAFFAAMAHEFIAKHPPQSPVLHEWGESFPAFLEHFPPLAAYPYMGDVARIEWARGQAFHAADALPISPAQLIGADPERLQLALHPSVLVLHLATPAVSIWQRNQPGGEGEPIGQSAEIALILRDRAFQVPVRAISAPEAALIAGLKRGETLAQAAAQMDDFDPTALLLQLMQAGALCERAEP